MPPIDVDERSPDRGNHLVDLLADGLGRPTGAAPDHDRFLRYATALGGVCIALLFTGVVTLVLT